MLVDTHCHLNYLHGKDNGKLQETLIAAQEKNVQKFICIGVDIEAMPEVLAIAKRFPSVYATVGVHPCSTDSLDIKQAIPALEASIDCPKVVAVGECGLDYYHSQGPSKTTQKAYFAQQIQLALQYDKPLVIHTRNAREDTIDILRQSGGLQARGVFHCFTESKEMAKKALDLGFLISFSGIITFKNAQDLQEVVRYVPLESMLIETDSPYLAPVPYRGKQNQPAFVVEVAKQVAALKGVSFETACHQTSVNAHQLFQLYG
jgi:TatD DNase family protein